jgi:hypothetical protein
MIYDDYDEIRPSKPSRYAWGTEACSNEMYIYHYLSSRGVEFPSLNKPIKAKKNMLLPRGLCKALGKPTGPNRAG